MTTTGHADQGNIARLIEGRPPTDALDRLGFLAEAGSLLASSLDFETTLANVARLVVPYLADWCLIYVLDEEGEIRRLVMEHSDPSKALLVAKIRREFPFDPRAEHGVPAVLNKGGIEFHPRADAKLLASDVLDPNGLAELLEPLGIESWICVPVAAHGRTLGAVSFVMAGSGRRYTESDLALAEEVGRRAAIAIENSRLLREARKAVTERDEALRVLDEALGREQEARRRAEHTAELVTRLQRITSALATGRTPAEMAHGVLSECVGALAARAGAMLLLDETGEYLEVHGYVGYSEDEIARWRRLSVTAEVPLAEAVRNQDLVLLRPTDARDARYPTRPGRPPAGQSFAAIPLISKGRATGGIALSFPVARDFPPEEQVFLRALGQQTALALQRATAETQVRLQKALLDAQNEATIDGILVVDAEGVMVSFNQRFFEMWEIPESVLTTRSDADAIASVLAKVEDPDEFTRRIAYLYTNPRETSLDAIKLRDGRHFDRYSAPVIGEDGTLHGRAWFFRDVTEQKRAESALLRERERAAFLAEAAQVLVASLDEEAVLEALTRHVVPFVADHCAVYLSNDDRERPMRRVAAAQIPTLEKVVAGGEDQPAGWRLIEFVEEVFTTKRSVIIPQTPATEADLARTGPVPTCLMVVPLCARERTPGVIAFVRATPHACYWPDDLALAEELAQRTALALDNARLYKERSSVARTLQESLLPPVPPEIPHLEVAARHHPAGARHELGGDFYDVFETSDEDWIVVIGDVCGKGAEAAAVTALARYTLRAASMQIRRPSRALATLNAAMLRHGDENRFCTVAYARVRTSPGYAEVTVACGGHPLPLLVRADGMMTSLGAPGSLLGAFPDPVLDERTVELSAGDWLLLYTDGITEARGVEGAFGEGRLVELLASCRGLPPAEIAAQIEERVLDYQGGHPRDDMALVILRVPE